MRIAIVVEYLHARGGTQRQALELAKRLGRLGHEVTVFTGLFDRGRCFPEINSRLRIVAVRERTSVDQTVYHSKRWLFRRLVGQWIRHTGLMYVYNYHIMAKSTQRLVQTVSEAFQANQFDLINPHDFGPAA